VAQGVGPEFKPQHCQKKKEKKKKKKKEMLNPANLSNLKYYAWIRLIIYESAVFIDLKN
jgi:glutamine amidotransferase-like uncharacterized protein